MTPAPTKGSAKGSAGDSGGDIKVTQVRSSICTKPKHRGTLRALGLRGVGQSHILPDRPEVRGMIARVPHLITVEPAPADEVAAQRLRSQATRQAHRAAEGRQSS
jgi:large subunit ribosomal protein L30